MIEVEFLMLFQLLPSGQSLLTGGTFQMWVLLLDMALEGGLTVADKGTSRTAIGDLFFVLSQRVLLQGCF